MLQYIQHYIHTDTTNRRCKQRCYMAVEWLFLLTLCVVCVAIYWFNNICVVVCCVYATHACNSSDLQYTIFATLEPNWKSSSSHSSRSRSSGVYILFFLHQHCKYLYFLLSLLNVCRRFTRKTLFIQYFYQFNIVYVIHEISNYVFATFVAAPAKGGRKRTSNGN